MQSCSGAANHLFKTTVSATAPMEHSSPTYLSIHKIINPPELETNNMEVFLAAGTKLW